MQNEFYDIVYIGNYTKDTITSPAGTRYVDGGGAHYAAYAAARLGKRVAVVTHLAAAAATVSWVAVEWIHRGKPTTLGAASGCVAGLVAITPACGFVGPMSALMIGLIAGAVCYTAVSLKPKFGYDDALDVVGVHCVGGVWGALATGLFASKLINEAGNNGLFFGNGAQLGVQALSVVVVSDGG